MKLYISLPKRFDKTEVIFIRKPCKKRQKSIKYDFEKKNVTDENNFYTSVQAINIMDKLEKALAEKKEKKI
jgi:hypothetical protein